MYRKILQNLRIKESPHFLPLFLVGLIAAVSVSALPASASDPAEFTLGWDANDEADLDGYEIFVSTGVPGDRYQFLAAVYVDELEDADNPTVTITDLITPLVRMAELANNSTYHFALTAFDTQGKTGGFSEELCVQVIGTTVVECGTADSSSGGGGGCFITPSSFGFRETVVRLFSPF